MAYDLKQAIIANKPTPRVKATPTRPPKVKPADNQPTKNNGGLSNTDFERKINNEADKPNAHSGSQAANNHKNNHKNDLNYDKPTIDNPENKKNNVDPDFRTGNHTPFQLIKQISEMTHRYGLPTLWQQSFPCPCISESGYPKADCPVCHGLGVAFKDPVELNVTYQHDNRQYYNGKNGLEDTGMALATPEMTENGIENGISPRDRLAVEGLLVTQTYLFRVNSKRINTGEFIPYHVYSIDLAVTMDDNQNIIKLKENRDFTFNKKASVFRPSKQFLDHNISLVMSVSLRFYVTNTLKETRYATTTDPTVKKTIMGFNKPNRILTNYVREYNKDMKPGETYYRMPKLLQVKRENAFLGNWDYSEHTSTKHRNKQYQQKQVNTDPSNPLHLFGR